MVWEKVENIKAHISFYAHFFLYISVKKERKKPTSTGNKTKP